MSLEIRIEGRELARALALGPEVLKKHVRPAIGRGIQEMARSARLKAPKFRSELVNAILPAFENDLSGVVIAGSDHALFVEAGTGPGGWPPEAEMAEWIRLKGVTPESPEMTAEDLAFLLARAIAVHGTPAQPFMAPAFEEHREEAARRVDRAIAAALAEIGA